MMGWVREWGVVVGGGIALTPALSPGRGGLLRSEWGVVRSERGLSEGGGFALTPALSLRGRGPLG